MMRELALALALLLALEGLFFAAFPKLARKMLQETGALPANMLRSAGLFAAALGVFAVWLIQNSG